MGPRKDVKINASAPRKKKRQERAKSTSRAAAAAARCFRAHPGLHMKLKGLVDKVVQ